MSPSVINVKGQTLMKYLYPPVSFIFMFQLRRREKTESTLSEPRFLPISYQTKPE